MNVELHPLTLTFVGNGPEPIAFQIADRRPSGGGRWTLPRISLVERAVLRALCQEALAAIDRAEADEAAS